MWGYMEQTIDIPREFLSLSWQNLEQIATYHERIANAARHRAKFAKEKAAREAQSAARVEYMADSYKKVLEYLSKGYNSTESAIAAAARDLNLPDFTVAGWWKHYINRRDSAARQERDRVIIDLVRLGVTNKDIAARLGIGKNTVTRAINGYLFKGFRPCDRARLFKRRRKNSNVRGSK